MTQNEAIVVLDYGSQYSQLIVRRVREAGVYSELVRFDADEATVAALNPKGIILSGGPNSVYAEGAPQLPAWVLASNLPVLGICYGLQLQAHHLGGKVEPSNDREFGHAVITITAESPLLADIPTEHSVWMSHGDRLETLPAGWHPIAISPNSP